MRHLFHSPVSLLILILSPLAASAQDAESVVTAREHYIDVLNAAQAVAADVQLILVTNGADIALQGEAHNWSYYFKSASLNDVLHFVYEQDDESVRRVTPVQDDVLPIRLHTDLPTIPTSWIDSNIALPEADAHGGNDYRAASNFDNYHIDMFLLPPSDGGRNALFEHAAWLVAYTGDIGELRIPVDAATGTFLDFGVATAQNFLADIDAMADEIGDDLDLVAVGSNIVRPDGTSPMWTYYYESRGQSEFFGFMALEGRLAKIPEHIGEGGDLFHGMPALPLSWIDSDDAITEAEQAGGFNFRQTHNEWQIAAWLATRDSPLPEWRVQYNAPGAEQQFIVSGIGGNPVTARDKLDEILTMATQHYADAELVVVNSSSLDLTGLSNQWSYFFKSVSTPDIFELRVLAGEAVDNVYPFGLNGHLDLFMTPIPAAWVDSDEAIEIVEQYGGSEFRQTHDGWNIVPELRYSQGGRLRWYFDYQSPSEATIYSVNAGIRVTARDMLADVLAQSVQEASDARLVSVGSLLIEPDGGSNKWSYIFTSLSGTAMFEVRVQNGEIQSDVSPVEPGGYLDPGMPVLADAWFDSDSALTISEQLGGSEFRQTNPDATIEATLAWAERRQARNRNLGRRPIFLIIYRSSAGSFVVAVDLEFGPYNILPKTTAGEKLALLADSVGAVGLPDDAELVNITSTSADSAGYADHWVYMYESPTEDQQYEFRVLGGQVITLDSVRSMVNHGLAPLPEDWIDSNLALKVAEQDGGADFRNEHQDYDILLDLQVANDGVFWDVLYGSSSGGQRFIVDALDFSVATEPIDLPEESPHLQIYPNPFSGGVKVAFTLPRSGDVSIDMYDILGRKHMTIVEEFLQAGSHVKLLAADELATGHYFLVLRAGDQVRRGRMVKVNR